MKALGYPWTWQTHCFLESGCRALVWAHTNGAGDFALFDELGYPWPIHGCYTNRIVRRYLEDRPDEGPGSFEEILARVRTSRDEIPAIEVEEAAEGRYDTELPPETQPQIEPATALDYLDTGDFKLIGYVQDIVENAVASQMSKLQRKLGTLGNAIQTEIAKRLESRRTQLTVVSDFQSFTVFADVGTIPLSKKDPVMLTLRASKSALPQLSGRHRDVRLLWPLFLCVEIQRIPNLKRKT